MRLIQTLAILLISVVGYSQDYQRLFATSNDADLNVIDAMQDDAGSTYVVSKFVSEDLEDQGLHISKHNLKGDIDWENEIILDGDYEITRYGDMQSIGQDSFLIAFQVKRDSVYSQALLRTGGFGQSEWTFNYYENTDSTNTARPVEIAVRDTSQIVVAGTKVDSIETMSLWTVDNTGVASGIESNFEVTDTLDNVYSYNFSEIDYDELDTTYVVSGKVLADSTQLFVARLGSDFSQVWARSYHLPDVESAQIYEQLLTDSGEIVIVGTLRPDFTRGFVAKLDTIGNVAWFTTLNNSSPLSGGTVLTNASLGQNGEIVIGGSYLENFVFSRPFMLAIDQDGSRLWERQYTRQPIVQYDLTSGITDNQEHLTIIDQGNILAAPDGGYVQVNTVQTVTSNLRQAININKTDSEGNSFRVDGEVATCDSDIDLVSGMTTVELDTLVFTSEALFEVSNSVAVTDTFGFVAIGAPILGLFADIQCPDDINVELNATLLNAETYEWNTGDSTAMITVMDTEEYTVTVTFDTETCFQLCDTIEVPVYEAVEGFIDLQERERWCGEPREFVLEAFATGGSGEYFYLWNQGENTKSVVRNEATADYTVTISDSCGQDTVITRTIFDTEFEQPDVADIVVDCADGAYVLTLVTSGSTFDESTIIWSSGQTGVTSITVTEEMVYSVNVIDDCFYEISASVDLNDVNNTMSLAFDGNSYCETGLISVEAVFNPEAFFTAANITWSTGPEDNGEQTISVTEFGEYTATIVDDCGNEVTASIDVPNLTQEPAVIVIGVQCVNNGFIYSIADPSQLIQSTIVWTDASGNTLAEGETSIEVEMAQSVTVTAVDNCQNTVTTTLNDSFEEVMISLMSNCGETSTTVTAQATGSVAWNVSGYQWSTGESEPEITVIEPGVFSVSVVDVCGETISDSISINQGNFWPCECVSWPNFMNLNTMDLTGERDATFGPVVNCGDLVSDYNLWIYNAYGNLLYTTSADAPREESATNPTLSKIGINWNGDATNSGSSDAMPSGVYKYYSTYTVDGETMEAKGEFTLVR